MNSADMSVRVVSGRASDARNHLLMLRKKKSRKSRSKARSLNLLVK